MCIEVDTYSPNRFSIIRLPFRTMRGTYFLIRLRERLASGLRGWRSARVAGADPTESEGSIRCDQKLSENLLDAFGLRNGVRRMRRRPFSPIWRLSSHICWHFVLDCQDRIRIAFQMASERCEQDELTAVGAVRLGEFDSQITTAQLICKSSEMSHRFDCFFFTSWCSQSIRRVCAATIGARVLSEFSSSQIDYGS